MEYFLTLKLSRLENLLTLNLKTIKESFRALKFSFRVLDFRVRKFSNLGSFRALKLSDLESFRVRISSIRVLRF